jgi:hypothetical protein
MGGLLELNILPVIPPYMLEFFGETLLSVRSTSTVTPTSTAACCSTSLVATPNVVVECFVFWSPAFKSQPGGPLSRLNFLVTSPTSPRKSRGVTLNSATTASFQFIISYYHSKLRKVLSRKQVENQLIMDSVTRVYGR